MDASAHEDIVRKLCHLLAEQTQRDPSTLNGKTSLSDGLVMDSLGQMALIVEIENTFEVCLTLSEDSSLPEDIDALAQLVEQAQHPM